ncbi:MAG: hypothetical protein A3F78_03820 [Burkholderiales bacterium RIFCSPLOWO2_12_FULL_61_40]|nr:MAG: hypothetical protein A3F78_03820 [Burkholderiales bacterium RIFCSPLOWO2_12_FULL_61_40]
MANAIGLFEAVPQDFMKFGQGMAFEPRKIPDFLGLKNEDVSRLAEVAISSVRYDHAMPLQMRDRLEEIAHTINMVAGMFDGDVNKTVSWFKVRNPTLGDVSPRDMIRLGRYQRVRKFIINAMAERNAKPSPRGARVG